MRQNKPIPFAHFLAHQEARNEAWRRKFAMDAAFADAVPWRGHRALARLVAQGRMQGIITQNIDGLHQASGVPDTALVELHGNGTYATCLDCGVRQALSWVRGRFEADGGVAPACPHCGGPVKSATISFGQAMPAREMERAVEMAQSCDLFIVLGSSLVVYPAAGCRRGAAGGGTARHHQPRSHDLDDVGGPGGAGGYRRRIGAIRGHCCGAPKNSRRAAMKRLRASRELLFSLVLTTSRMRRSGLSWGRMHWVSDRA